MNVTKLLTFVTPAFTFICEGGESYTLGFLALGVASSVPQLTQSEEVFGIYTLGPPDTMAQDSVWFYSEEALELDAARVFAGGVEPAAVTLNLEPGWNQAILTLGQPVRLESAPIPESFVWSEF